MVMANENALNGMNEICGFLNRSEPTVLALKRAYPEMPINKVGGIWAAHKKPLDEWWQRFTSQEGGPSKKVSSKKIKKQGQESKK